MAKRRAGKAQKTEAIFFYLYDAGRFINLTKAHAVLGSGDGPSVRLGRDTPEYISLPRPLSIDIARRGPDGIWDAFSAVAKLYADGAVSIILRARLKAAPEELHGLRKRPVGPKGEDFDRFAADAFGGIFAKVKPFIDRVGYPEGIAVKTYAAFCIVDDVGNPAAFIAQHSRTLSALLIDESDDPGIHDSQIANTLGNPFSYRSDELAVFDFDRCLVVDPRGDYEDILLVVEHANYQLLELRQLDLLLDRRLEVAEGDMRSIFAKRRALPAFRGLGRKFAEIQALRLDALFILENLENSSKIIGDYHLGRIYDHVCGILNTAGWKWSVERRLETLQSIYELARGDVNDRTMLFLEIVFILVCVFQVFQYFFFK